MAKISHRLFAGFFAVLFLVTSSTVAIAFIVSNIQSKNSSSTSSSSTVASSNCSATLTGAAGQKLAGFTPVGAVSQLKITDLSVGTGPAVKPGATISAEYSGAVATTGTIFQTSSTPVSFSLDQVINGWAEGIPGMKLCGERQLLIPASAAYGANPPANSGIPANAPLVFDVILKSISSN